MTTAAMAGDGLAGLRSLVTVPTMNASKAVPTISAMNADFRLTTRQALLRRAVHGRIGKYSPNTMALNSLPGPPRSNPPQAFEFDDRFGEQRVKDQEAAAAPATCASQ